MFPSSPSLAAKWTELCGHGESAPPPYSRVCSEHFSPMCYQRDLQHELLGLPLRKKLKRDAVPNRKLPENGPSEVKVRVKKNSKQSGDADKQKSVAKLASRKALHVLGLNLKKKSRREADSNQDTTTIKQKSVPSLLRVQTKLLQPQPLDSGTKHNVPNVKPPEITIEAKSFAKSGSKICKQIPNKNGIQKPKQLPKTFKEGFEQSVGSQISSRRFDILSKLFLKTNPSPSETSFDCSDYSKGSAKLLTANTSSKAGDERKLLKHTIPMRSSIRIAKRKSLEEKQEYALDFGRDGDSMVAKIQFLKRLQLRRNKNRVCGVVSKGFVGAKLPMGNFADKIKVQQR